MRKSLALIFGVLLVSVGVMAQSHDNMTERKAEDQVRFWSPVKIGSHILKADDYVVKCDTKTITFYRLTKRSSGDEYLTKVFDMPCQGKQLDAKRERTEMSVTTGPDGVQILDKLYLKGSNVEHVFPGQ